MNESNATKSLASHTVSLVDTLSMLENLEESQSMPMIEDSRSVSEEVIGDKAIESTEIGISSNDSCGSLSGNLRCLHNSATGTCEIVCSVRLVINMLKSSRSSPSFAS